MNGKALIIRVYENLLPLREKGINVIVATDSEKIVELDPERDIKSQIAKVYLRADPDTRATFSDVLKIIKEELTEEELKRYAEIKERYHSH